MHEQKWDEILTSLRPMFDPSSVAIIGASSNPNKPSGQPLVALLKNGYKGKIYPVNPRYTSLHGIPCYPSVTEIPGTVDLAIIAVPARQVLDQMRACSEKKVPAVIIFTSGFAETGPEGAQLQKQLADMAHQNGIRVCGPNCMGIFGARNSLMANFSIDTLPDRVIVQDFLGFISQSGGFGSAVYEIIRDRGIGFSYFISTGNEADVDFAEYIAFLAKDEHTRVIGGYLEGVKDGRKFIQAVDMANRAGKPILLIKTGRHEAAARAAASHTGALVGSDNVYQALFRQKGILRMESIEEMKVALSVLASGKMPGGNKVC
ncbi:MAG: acetate--CoA ligase family protein, partial [Bacillota bacterium]